MLGVLLFRHGSHERTPPGGVSPAVAVAGGSAAPPAPTFAPLGLCASSASKAATILSASASAPSAETDEEGMELLRRMKFPFRDK